jgi:hypothetical protein
MIDLIRQEDDYGCGVACAAMILNKSYAEVRKDFENDFSKKGVPLKKLVKYIGDHGYQAIRKEVVFYNHKNCGDAEMFKPFAPTHMLLYTPQFDSPNNHVVVMDENGKLYCPGGGTDAEIRSAYRVNEVVGFFV